MSSRRTLNLLWTLVVAGALSPMPAWAHGAEQAISSIVVAAAALGLAAGLITAAIRRRAPLSFVVVFTSALIAVGFVLAFSEAPGNPFVGAAIVGVFAFVPAAVAFAFGIAIIKWTRGAFHVANRDS
jgi:hypothetical protein